VSALRLPAGKRGEVHELRHGVCRATAARAGQWAAGRLARCGKNAGATRKAWRNSPQRFGCSRRARFFIGRPENGCACGLGASVVRECSAPTGRTHEFRILYKGRECKPARGRFFCFVPSYSFYFF
jgi:hypothetical protein